MARPLADFLKKLPSDTVSLQLRVGTRENPKDGGYIDLSDYGGIAALDVEALSVELTERAEAAGWPVDWPCWRVEARPEAKGAGKMSASWQETQGSRARDTAGPAGPGDAYMAATALAKSALDAMARSNADLTAALGQSRRDADQARGETVDAILAAKDAELLAQVADLRADLSGGADPAADRGASALERLAEGVLGKMSSGGGPGAVTAEDLLASMEAAPDAFYDGIVDDPRLDAVIQRALARRAAKAAGTTPGNPTP